MSFEDEDDFMGGGTKTFSFDEVGDMVVGYITERPKKEQQKDMKTGEPKTWNDGSPQWMWRITLQTDLRDDKDDDGLRSIYVSWKRHDAIKAAVKAAGEKNLAIGGKLALRFLAFGPVTQKGFAAPKVDWQAWYKAPEPDSMFMNAAAQATPAGFDSPPAATSAATPAAASVSAYDASKASATLAALKAQKEQQAATTAVSDAFPEASAVGTPGHHSTEEPPF